MQVTILDETNHFNKISGVFEQVQTFINHILENKKVYFSHMIIDGVEVYHDYEYYIEDHLSQIENIHVEVKTPTEFIQDIVDSIQQYVERALPEIKQLADSFYQSSQSESWDKLHDLIEAIQWIHESIVLIDREKAKPYDWDKFLITASSFENIFPNMMEALEARDNILIADILTYEISPLFQEIHQLNLSEVHKRDTNHVEEKH